jgi:hypothetical protein
MESFRPAATTEITVLGGEQYRVVGTTQEVERAILNADRGAIMEFAWLVEADTGERIGINPACLVMLRASGS